MHSLEGTLWRTCIEASVKLNPFPRLQSLSFATLAGVHWVSPLPSTWVTHPYLAHSTLWIRGASPPAPPSLAFQSSLLPLLHKSTHTEQSITAKWLISYLVEYCTLSITHLIIQQKHVLPVIVYKKRVQMFPPIYFIFVPYFLVHSAYLWRLSICNAVTARPMSMLFVLLQEWGIFHYRWNNKHNSIAIS